MVRALSQKVRSIAVIITLIKIAGISFYFGYINAINENNSNVLSSVNIGESGGDGSSGCSTTITPKLQQRIDARIKQHHKPQPGNTKNNGGKLFPDTTREFVEGILSVSNKEFLHNPNYDFGVPFKSASEHSDALILYNTKRSIPTSDKILHDAAIHGEKDTGHIAQTSMSTALENCDAMNVIFLPYGYTQTRPSMNDCYTIMGNLESYHINRYFRMPDFETTNKHERELKPSHPLRHFGRVTLPKGIAEFDLPEVWRNYKRGEKGFVLEHFDALRTFVENVDTVQSELKELITKRNAVRGNTVVVMTVNVGQSELLANFVCAARSRGLDISNVVVFPTDIESKTLAEGLGVTTYFDEKNLGALPKGEARMYGDKIFASMMYAKILCVVYVSMLGYDVLFQDVDMVWFKDPLEYFHDPSNTSIQNFDILFQHDGSGQMRYSKSRNSCAFIHNCLHLYSHLHAHGYFHYRMSKIPCLPIPGFTMSGQTRRLSTCLHHFYTTVPLFVSQNRINRFWYNSFWSILVCLERRLRCLTSLKRTCSQVDIITIHIGILSETL